MLQQGDPAPDFTLRSDASEQVSLSDFRGRPVVLYFYPADDTPGCTAQACGFRDDWAAYEEHGAVVLGVSPDDVDSHVRFRDKYGLPFPLLADPDHRVADRYGAWGEKNYRGKTYVGIIRSAFVIDADGRHRQGDAERECHRELRAGARPAVGPRGRLDGPPALVVDLSVPDRSTPPPRVGNCATRFPADEPSRPRRTQLSRMRTEFCRGSEPAPPAGPGAGSTRSADERT